MFQETTPRKQLGHLRLQTVKVEECPTPLCPLLSVKHAGVANCETQRKTSIRQSGFFLVMVLFYILLIKRNLGQGHDISAIDKKVRTLYPGAFIERKI